MNSLSFGGNPLVLQLLESPKTELDKLLDIDSFPSQFRTCNPNLQKYMDITKYNTLVQYVTEVGDPTNRNRSYRYPMIAADILSIQNQETLDAIFREGKIIVRKIEVQERWVQKEVDECDSQYCSSEGSGSHVEDYFENSDRENIPPQTEKSQLKLNNSISKKKSDKNSDSSSQGRKSLGASSASITSDDFPFAQQIVKKIKVKEMVTRQIEIEIKPLLQQLCQFFQKQVNYTLTGYVTKILQFLLKKNPRRILRQFFTTKIHKSLIKHLQSQIACDFIINMLLCSQNEVENARQYFLSMLLKNLISWHSDQDKMILNKSILYVLVQINGRLDPSASKWHTVLMDYMYQQPSLIKMAPLIFDAKTANKNRQVFLNLYFSFLKKLLNPIILNPANTAASSIKSAEEQKIKQLRQRLLIKIEPCFKEFIDKLWQNLLELSDKDTPSYVYIKQFEILNMMIKNNLFWSRMQLSNQDNIFGPLLDLCKKFKNNNFLHNQVFDLLKEIVHNCSQMPMLFKKAFSCKNFLNFCLETVSESDNHVMYRGQSLRHKNTEQVQSLKSQFKSKWSKIQQSLLANVQKINSTLGGFCVKRPHKIQIRFNKQDILKRFDSFLKGEVSLKKTKSMEEEELQNISNQSNDEWSDWSQFSNYSTDEVDQKKQ